MKELTIQEAADLKGMEAGTLRKQVETGLVPGARFVGPTRRGIWLIPESSLPSIHRRHEWGPGKKGDGVARAEAAIQQLLAEGAAVHFRAVAQRSGVSPAYLFKQEELAARIRALSSPRDRARGNRKGKAKNEPEASEAPSEGAAG